MVITVHEKGNNSISAPASSNFSLSAVRHDKTTRAIFGNS